MDKKHYELEQSFYKTMFTTGGKYGKSPFLRDDPSESMVGLLFKHGLVCGLGKRALDIGCGSGRHIAFLRQCGYEVVGVDFCETALELCQQKFKNDPFITLKKVDLTENGCLDGLGQFDLVLQWSILNHLRAKYIPTYLRNINAVVGNHFIISEFAHMMGKFKNKSFKIDGGHYSRCYTMDELIDIFGFNVIDSVANCDEAKPYGIKFHTILFQNTNNK